MKAVLDAGALVAVDRRDRMIGAQLRVLQQQGTPIRVSSAVVGQVWRDGRKQANLARVLAGVGIEALGQDDGRRIGELLAVAAATDVVDAHVALMAAGYCRLAEFRRGFGPCEDLAGRGRFTMRRRAGPGRD